MIRTLKIYRSPDNSRSFIVNTGGSHGGDYHVTIAGHPYPHSFTISSDRANELVQTLKDMEKEGWKEIK